MSQSDQNAVRVAGTPLRPPPFALTSNRGSSRLNLTRGAWIAAVIVAGAAIAGWVPRWRQHAILETQMHDLAVPTVLVATPGPGAAGPGLVLPAEIKPLVEAPIYARASGYLKRWLVDIGAHVETGQLLAEIDTPEINQELARARAELGQAQASLELAKTTASRWADLLKSSSVSEQEAAEKKADLALKEATVEAAQANVRRLEDLQAFERVLAPFAGTITARRTDVGELITAGSGKELFRLAQTRTLRVFVQVPQTAARSIYTGQSAELVIPEMSGRVFPAKVVRTSGAMNPDSRTLLVELAVDNPANEILSGSFAQVQFKDAQAESHLTVASTSLIFRAEGPQLALVHPGGKVELRTVKLGRDFGPALEILSGVTAADWVIVNPADSLVSGAQVRVANPGKSSAAAK